MSSYEGGWGGGLASVEDDACCEVDDDILPVWIVG